jgi:plastocyanin
MNNMLIAFITVVFVGSVGVDAPHGRAADNSQTATGSIKGKITASGVRDVENVLVFVEKAPGEFPPPKDPADIDQQKMTFVPHVLPIVKGTIVKFNNSDPVLHNVFWNRSDYGPYDARNLGTFGKGSNSEFTFDKEGSVVLLCNIHPEMEGHIVVLQNPYFALASKEGTYEITGIPAGQYTVKTWYPSPKKLKASTAPATVTAGQTTKLDFSLSRK